MDITIRLGTENEKKMLLVKYPHIQNVLGNGGYFVVSAIQNDIIGYAWAFKRKIPAPVDCEELFINIIEVIYSNFRSKGIASEMAQKIIEIAKSEQIYQIRAYCDISNIPSHRLWLKNRFSISPCKEKDGSISGSFVSLVI